MARQATWHLRPSEPTELSRFRAFVKSHGFVQDHFNNHLGFVEIHFARGDQTIKGEFDRTRFLGAWLHASKNHRGIKVHDKAQVEQFVVNDQEWAIANANWPSEDEGSVVERSLERDYEDVKW